MVENAECIRNNYVTIPKLFGMITLSQDEFIIEASLLYIQFVVTEYATCSWNCLQVLRWW